MISLSLPSLPPLSLPLTPQSNLIFVAKMPVPQPEIATAPASLKGWPFGSSALDIKTTTKVPLKVAPFNVLPQELQQLQQQGSDSESFLSASPSPIEEVPEMQATERLDICQQQQVAPSSFPYARTFLSSPVTCSVASPMAAASLVSAEPEFEAPAAPAATIISSCDTSSAWETTVLASSSLSDAATAAPTATLTAASAPAPASQAQQHQSQRRNSRVRREPQRALDSSDSKTHLGVAFSFAAHGSSEGFLNVISRQYEKAVRAPKPKRKGTMLFPEYPLGDNSAMDISALLNQPLGGSSSSASSSNSSRLRDRAVLKRSRRDETPANSDSEFEQDTDFAALSSLATAFIPADIPFGEASSMPSSPLAQVPGSACMRTPGARKNKQCACCGATSTPLWRDIGKELPLCNACGIRWKKYGIVCDNCQYVPCKQERESKICMRCNSKLAPASKRARIPSAASPTPTLSAPSTPTQKAN